MKQNDPEAMARPDAPCVTAADPLALLEAQARLQCELDYYRTLFETFPDPLWVVEGDRYVECNEAAVQAMGYASREDMLSRPVSSVSTDLQPCGERSYDKAVRLLEAAREGKVQRFEWRHRQGPDGDRIVEISLSPVRCGDRLRVLGTWHDLTAHKRAEQRLLDSERSFREQSQRLQEVLEGTNTGTWECNLATGRLVCNGRWADMVGLSREELQRLTAEDWQARVHPDDLVEALRLIRACCRRELDRYRIELRVRHRDGHWVWTADRGSVVEWSAEGRALRMAGTSQDITFRKQAEEQLKLAASVFTHASEGIMITDATARIVSVNQAFSRITGYTAEEVLGRSPAILRSGLHGEAFYAEVWDCLRREGHWSGEIWNRHRDGHLYAELVNISAVYDDQGRIENYVALFNDITALKNHQQQLEHRAHYDALTDLPNRLLLGDRLSQAMSRARRQGGLIAVAYIDLDGFKAVNDTYGHAVGDQLLVQLAGRMKTTLREGDTLARLGGDEFVAVILDVQQHSDCLQILDRLLQQLSDPVAIDRQLMHVTASIGVTLYPLDDADADQLLRHADQAMYLAKQAGKNRYHVFDERQSQAGAAAARPLAGLKRALERNELLLHFQPRVHMSSGELKGAEALLRWCHPQDGLLLPAAFLGTAESNALACEIDRWVIEQALGQVVRWRNRGLNIPVSVNVSPAFLMRRDFAETLGALLEAHPGVGPGALELELMENHALEDISQIARIIDSCAALGVRFALDDFGTSHTSLSYLRRLRADTLKLDQRFVQAMPSEPEDLAMVEAALGLASAFRRQLIAEGVESEWQGEMLLAIGCEYAQGFAIGRPMPADELPGWAQSWRPYPGWVAWLDRRLRQDALPLLLAMVEHCAWREALLAYLGRRSDSVPELNPEQCHFARWYVGEGARLFGHLPGYLGIGQLHLRLHELAATLVADRVAPVQRPDFSHRLASLHRLSEQLHERLRELASSAGEAE